MGADASQPPPDEPREDALEDRRMLELLNELRVALPGVQVLFAFLLAVPFQQRFGQITEFERDVYFVTLVAAAVATALLVAPSAYHRMTFGHHQRPRIIRVGSREMILGLVSLAIAMNGAVLLVTDLLFSTSTVIITVTLLTTLFAWLWFGMGLVRRLRS